MVFYIEASAFPGTRFFCLSTYLLCYSKKTTMDPEYIVLKLELQLIQNQLFLLETKFVVTWIQLKPLIEVLCWSTFISRLTNCVTELSQIFTP